MSVAPLSQREVGLKSDSPTLAAADYSGSAPAVNGDDTLSCSSPPNFSEMHITHEKQRQPQGGAELESGTATPTLASPLSSALAMITPVKTCQPVSGTGSKGTPIPDTPQSSVSKRTFLRLAHVSRKVVDLSSSAV